MSRYTICVYAICKNEAAFVPRWMHSMSEADRVVVLDTGSTDGTPELLRRCGAEVTVEEMIPWRFDAARNRSLELVPAETDICVCTDLDEVFRPGWRAALERSWGEGVSQASYRYTWSFLPDGREGHVFWIEKIHQRRGFRWTHPVHEVLTWSAPEPMGRKVLAEGVQLDHHPDPNKSRGQYLPLLELSVAEDPEDDRNLHYLGREYLYQRRWDDCIAALTRHLALPRAVWRDERAASMRYLAQAFRAKGEENQAQTWLLRAAAEAPYLREPWLDLAWSLYQRGEWEGVLWATGRALAIENRPRTYISEPAAWGSLPHDLRAVAFFQTGRLGPALEAARLALASEPENDRLRQNAALLEQLADQSPQSAGSAQAE